MLDFSIIVPTFARPGQLGDCLRAVQRLDYPRDRFEVIVVDDGSPSSLESVVAPFCDQVNVALLRQLNAGPAAARITGAARAGGRFLAFTDDDCVPAPGWLSALAAPLTTEANLMVGGQTVNALAGNPYSAASQLIQDVVYAYYNANPQQAHFLACNNLALPADTFRALGGFDPTFRTSEDRDLCDRWLGCGYRIVYVPDAVMYHSHHLTFRAFWQQHVAYGRGAFRFNRAHARRGGSRSTLETGFYWGLFGSLRERLSPLPRERARTLAILMTAWQVANTVGFVSEGLAHLVRKQWVP